MLENEKIKEAIENIRPMLQADGGDVELKAISEDGKVYLTLQGACGSCPMATFTLKMGIEARLKEMFPEITEVVAV
ncbi:MAG: NifU family protein [Treponema sp.]